jgi:hypothetical protein
MAIDDAAEQLEKERTSAGRLAEVRAADRRRALAEQQSQNEGRNRAPDLYNDRPAELLEQEYGQPTGAPAGEEEDQEESDENENREEPGKEPQKKGNWADRFGPQMASQNFAKDKGAQMVALQRAAAKKRQVLIKQSEKRSGELTKKIKNEQGKIDTQRKNRILGCLLWFIPVLGWIAKVFQRILTAKSRVEAIKAKAEIPVLKRKLDAEKNNLQSALKKQQQQMAQQMRKQK